MRNIKLTLSFDGTDFSGYQIQANAHTIEAEIKNSLAHITKEDISIVGCGRTDSGVHAYKYIINFKTNSNISLEKFPLAINGNINKAIVVEKAEECDMDFHARFCVLEKTYVYRILNSKTNIPFERLYTYKYGGELDCEKMSKACEKFVGTHDFTSHKSLGTETKDSIRTIYYCNLERKDDIIEISITANGFLYNMARTIAGTILECGKGKIEPCDIEKIIESKDRRKAGATLPAHGLFMKEIKYK
ncbi:MAG: tRNA pseudouridine(38-40) synthase TruA [Clostridia bacterium]